MNVQLVLYPQSYNGGVNDISYSSTEVLANGINFYNLSSTSSFDSPVGLNQSPIDDAISNNYPATLNTWYRLRTTIGGTPALPTNTLNNLVLNSIASTNMTGIYQRVSNVIVGQNYTVTVNISVPSSGVVNIVIHDGITSFSTGAGVASGSVVTHNFTAITPTPIIVITRSAATASDLTISSISVLPTGTAPTLENGQVICDLYEDEDIPLSLSVDDFKNVAEKVQSYSKAFKLPATKRNNQIFDNIFEITRTAQGNISFNPYLKTQCELKQDGFILFEGYLKLIDIQDKEGEISYNVNLYANVTSLADVLKDRKFSALDFTELEHLYNKDNITASFYEAGAGITYINPSTSGFRNANDTVKYPFVDWTRQIPLADGLSGNSATIGYPELTNLTQAFRPFIQVKYLIDRIFNEPNLPFSYSSDFFDTDDFKRLYMDFNWGTTDDNIEMTFGAYGASNSSVIDPIVYSTTSFAAVHISDANFDASLGWDGATAKFTASYNSQTYIVQVNHFSPSFASTQTFETRWAHYNSGGVLLNTYDVTSQVAPFGFLSPALESGPSTIIADATDYIQFEWKTNTAGEGIMYWGNLLVLSASAGTLSTTTNSLLQTLRGETGQWEFLKGIMTMFNLITVPDVSNSNNIIIEPYGDIFLNNADSKQLNWTDKIDVSQMKLTPLTDLNKKTIFKFVEDEDDYAFKNYKESVDGHLYGSQVYNAEIPSGPFQTLLEGTEEIVAEPFAATVPKPYSDIFLDFIVPAIYSYNVEDGTSEGFDNKPRIMYNTGHKTAAAGTFTSCTYYIPEQNGGSSTNQDSFLQFSHLSDIPTSVSVPPVITDTRDFHFGVCQLIPPIGQPTPNNLFNTYWLPYFGELYNADTRTMTIKVNLNAGDISTFNFYDTIMIKNREFRVNKIDYKPNDLATVEFILIP